MKTIKYKILVLVVLPTLGCIATSCNEDDDYDFTYETIVTESPVNLEQLNTEYDDYNSALPYEGFRHGIYFSTNRKNSGNNFDIIYKEMDISYHEQDDILNISFVLLSNTYDPFDTVLEEINSNYDELGPYTHWGIEDYEYFFYANNESGNFDIKYVSSKKGNPSDYNLNTPFVSLNSEYDDLYPCISNNDIYFCSNRENGNYNIFNTIFTENEINPDHEEMGNNTIELNSILSSSKNDKCPYLHENIIVFTSDREGGYGGFDLYFSKKIDGVWSAPQNLGDKINSEFDEYRPIIIPFSNFDETMLIFSSNREGGKGGFDLYSVRTNI